MRALLDINVLIAALDADHVHHSRARDWIEAGGKHGWASCPLTQNGCVRIMSLPAYPSPLPPPEVIARLRQAVSHPSHAFWPDDVSLTDARVIHTARVHGPRQVTDLYLLALAVRHKGRLVTFDSRIPLSAVLGARAEHVVVL